MPGALVLAFDTSAAHCAAALLSGERILATRFAEMGRGQAEALMPLISDLMDEGGVAPRDLSAIGVSVGPGNFTGIRISVSAARGMALALNIPAIGVSNFDLGRLGGSTANATAQLVSIPAPRGQAYLQLFDKGVASGLPFQTDVDMPNLPRPLPNGVAIVGFRAADIAATLNRADPMLAATAHDRVLLPDAEPLARIALQRLMASPDHPRPAPLYVRAADAAPSRLTAPLILP